MAQPGIPLSVELATGWKALGRIRRHLGMKDTAGVLSTIMLAMRRGEPFGDLDPPADRREALSRKQLAPAVLLYRALRERLEPERTLELTREVAVTGARIFLRRMVGLLDRRRFENMEAAERESFVDDIGQRFFNAELRFDEISPERLRFSATACKFPSLCRAAAAPEIAPLLCEGDELFFGTDLPDVELHRPCTIAQGAEECPFTLRFTGNS